MIAGGRSNLTFRVTDATATLRAAPAAAPARAGHRARHGPRAQDHRRRRHDQRAGAAGARCVHRRGGQRGALLRDGLRRRRRARQRRPGRGAAGGAAPRRPASTSSTCSPTCTPSTSTRSASATWPSARATSSARSSAGRRSGRTPRPASCRRSTRSPAAARAHARAAGRGRSPTATTASATASPTSTTGRIAAVLDWELCTLGDPLADVGYLGVYWSDGSASNGRAQRSDRRRRLRHATPSCSSATRRAPAATSAAIGYYVAFCCWRLAVISEGVYSRYLHGAMGDAVRRTTVLNGFKVGTEMLAESGLDAMSDDCNDGFDRHPVEGARRMDAGKFTAAGIHPPDVPPGHRSWRRRHPRDPRHHPVVTRVRQRRGRRRLHRGDAVARRHSRQGADGRVRGRSMRRCASSQGVHDVGDETDVADDRAGCAHWPGNLHRRRRPRRRGRRHVLQRRVRAGDDGRRHDASRPCCQPAVVAVRRRLGTRRRTSTCRPPTRAAVAERAAQGCQVLGLRFTDDRLVGDRFATLRTLLGDAFIAVELAQRDEDATTPC